MFSFIRRVVIAMGLASLASFVMKRGKEANPDTPIEQWSKVDKSELQ